MDSSGVSVWIKYYRYDHLNRLVRTNYDSDPASSTNPLDYDVFVHDGNQIVEKLAAIGGATIALNNRYLWGPMVDQLLADEDFTSSVTRWALTDHLGTVKDLVTYDSGTDTTTNVLHRVDDGFGNLISATGTATTLFNYTGKIWDITVGLQWNINRWYDPTIGQWISEDPIGFSAGQMNLRMYVGNHPTYASDPSGLAEFRDVVTDGITRKYFTADGLTAQLGRAREELQSLVDAGSLTENERDLRLALIEAAIGHKMGFSSSLPPDPKYYEERDGGYYFRPGVVIEGLDSRVYRKGAGGKYSMTGCTRAAQVLMLYAVGRLAEKLGKADVFDRKCAGHTIQQLFGPTSSILKLKTDYRNGLDPAGFLPGDRVRMRNHKFQSGADPVGNEGSNVIYVGKDAAGEQLYVHMDSPYVETFSQLRKTVQGYSAASRQDPNLNNYKFVERYIPTVPGFLR